MPDNDKGAPAAEPALNTPAPAELLVPPADAVAPQGPKKAVVIVGNHQVPKDGRLVIVTEGRTYETNAEGDVTGVTLKTDKYPSGADIYFRTDWAVSFPEGAQVITLGVDVLQGHFWGFTMNEQYVCVGPAHPAYAAANLAYQRGARTIEIVGLTEREKTLLQPFFDALPTDTIAPAQVAVSLT